MEAQRPTTEQVVPLPRGELRINPRLNPRFIFKDLEALAASLRKGQIEPLIVRRAPDGGGYEVGEGARRLKAAEIGKLPELLCIVRDLSDADMLRMSVSANGDREDLHPLEEGAAFARLRDDWRELGMESQPSVEEVAAGAVRSKSYVLARVRLHSDLGPKAREAFAAGRFGLAAAQAFLVAGSAERQDLVFDEVLRSVGSGKVEPDLVRKIVRERFLLRLADARFPRGDAGLVEGAPPCGQCPKNSANQPELFEGAKIQGDALCTDSTCFESKKKAHSERSLAAAREDGCEELKPKEARQAWAQAAIGGPSEWVPSDVCLAQDMKGRTLDQLLGKTKVPRGYAFDDHGWFRSLVRRVDAAAGLRRAGHAGVAARVEVAGKKEAKTSPDEAARRKATTAIGELVRAAEHAHGRIQVSRAVLLAMVAHLAEQALPETLVQVVRRRGLDDAGAKGSVRGRARAMVAGHAAGLDPGPLFALCVELVAGHDVLAQLELRPKEREGRPLWVLLDSYGVGVEPKKRPKPAAAKKAKGR
jgi:ParB/RepB/Spo0J family partition protein